jgi:hypothetical protein
MLGFAPARDRAGAAARPLARSVRDLGDLVLDAQLLALQGANEHRVRQWSVSFFVDLVLEAGMLGLKRLDPIFHSHRKTSVSGCAQLAPDP